MSDPVTPTGVDHVAINVSDVPAGITFYTETMGLVQNHTRPDFGFPGAWLDTANGQQVHLIEAGVPNNVGQHFASLSRIWARRSPSCGTGASKVTDPTDVGTTGRQQAFTVDPWGNAIELHQRAPEPGCADSIQSVSTLTCLRPRRSPNFTTPSAVANSVSSPPRPTFTPG